MLYGLLSKIDRLVGIKPAKAHCDIPCGIYDPHQAQVAALTVIRMLDLMADLTNAQKTPTLEYHNSISRQIAVKEEHA